MDDFLPPLTTPGQASDYLTDKPWRSVDVSADWLDFTSPYHRPGWTLSYNGVCFAPVGGLHVLTGKPGNGKTMTFTQLMVAILRGECGGLRYELGDEAPEPSVLYIDTEMEVDNTIAVKNRICSMMGWPISQQNDRLKILRLRETRDPEQRWLKVIKAVDEVRPTVCFLDGIIDLVDDFNSIEACQPLIYDLMIMASYYHLSLWCVIHENPFTTKMVGNLGSIIERKVTDAFATVKDKSNDAVPQVSFTVEQRKARGRDVGSWKFEVVQGADGWGIPQMAINSPADPQILAPDAIESLGWALGKDLSYPAGKSKISEYLTRHGVASAQIGSVMDQLMKMGFIRTQDLGEMKPGQKFRHIVLGSRFTKDNELPF